MQKTSWIISKSGIAQYFLIFLLFMVHGNRVFDMFNDPILIMIIAFGGLFIVCNQKRVGKGNVLFLLILAVLLLVLFIITNGSMMITSILALLARYIIAYHAFYRDRYHFVERFVKLTYFIAVISLFGFALTQLIPEQLQEILPMHTYYRVSSWSGERVSRSTYHLLFFQFRSDHDITRNIGMFNESGIYQIILNTALYFLLFKKEQCNMDAKRQRRYLIVLLIALITCQSLTGYIGFAIIYFGYIFTVQKNYRWRVLFVFVIAAIGISVYVAQTGTDSWLYQNVLRKMFDEQGNIDLSRSTGESRLLSMDADLRLFLSNPLGLGTRYYDTVWRSYLRGTIGDVSSCVGLTKAFAIYGLIPTLMMLGYYFKNKNRTKENVVDLWVCLLLILNTTLAQPSVFFPAFIVSVLVMKNADYISITESSQNKRPLARQSKPSNTQGPAFRFRLLG